MPVATAEPSFAFLFKTDVGRIDRRVWWRGTIMLGVPLLALTLGWMWLAPWANRDLSERAFVDPATLVAFLYLVIYAGAILLGAICHYNLSAKRWRDRGKPSSLAGLPPLAALVDGSAHWLQPRVAEVMPFFAVIACDAALIVILAWHVIELGFLLGVDPAPTQN